MQGTRQGRWKGLLITRLLPEKFDGNEWDSILWMSNVKIFTPGVWLLLLLPTLGTGDLQTCFWYGVWNRRSSNWGGPNSWFRLITSNRQGWGCTSGRWGCSKGGTAGLHEHHRSKRWTSYVLLRTCCVGLRGLCPTGRRQRGHHIALALENRSSPDAQCMVYLHLLQKQCIYLQVFPKQYIYLHLPTFTHRIILLRIWVLGGTSQLRKWLATVLSKSLK